MYVDMVGYEVDDEIEIVCFECFVQLIEVCFVVEFGIELVVIDGVIVMG